MDIDRIEFRVHAVRRMFERCISSQDVKRVLRTGVVIADYPDDQPYPSRLVLGFIEGRAVHVVIARNAQESIDIVITAYEPSIEVWEPDFRRKRK